MERDNMVKGAAGGIQIRSKVDDQLFQRDSGTSEDGATLDLDLSVWCTPPKRKLKQNRYDSHDENEGKMSTYTSKLPQGIQSNCKRVPEDQEDYSHQPSLQTNIRRPIINHQRRPPYKEQVFKLSEENRLLRQRVKDLENKERELCEKNADEDLENLNNIPVKVEVSETPYQRKQAKLATVFKVKSSAGFITPKDKLFPTNLSKLAVVEMPKPLINISSSGLAYYKVKTMYSVNAGTTPLQNLTTTKSNFSKKIRISGITEKGDRFIPITSL